MVPKIKMGICSFILAMVVMLVISWRSAQADTLRTLQAVALGSACEETIISTTISPNKAWKATLYTNYCPGDYTFETTQVVKVSLSSVTNPSNNQNVFAIDTAGDTTMNPQISWNKLNVLTITTIKSTYITLQNSLFSGVKVLYTYR